jgi:PKD repeat protein
MRGIFPRIITGLSILTAIILLSSCGGGKQLTAPGVQRVVLPEIEFSVTLPPGADIDPADVSYERLTLEEALSGGRAPSDLPDDFRAVEAFVIRPENTVFDLPARIRLVPEEELPEGTRLFLFRVGASRRCIPIDDGYIRNDGSVSFDTYVFGFFIVAENTLIARPSDAFLCYGFADVGDGPIPLTVNFHVFSFGGVEPIEYIWDFDDGSGAVIGSDVTHTFYEIGEYEVSVHGEDAIGAISPGFSTIIKATSEYLPLESVSVYVFPTDASAPLERHFIPVLEGGVPPLTWEWDFSNGYTTNERDPVYEFPEAGIFSGSVTVTDAVLDQVSSDFMADLRHVYLSADPNFGYAPMSVTFEVSAEGLNPDATVVLDYGDGERVSVDLAGEPLFVHYYDLAGTYPARVEAFEMFEGSPRYVYSLMMNIVIVEGPIPIVYSIFPPQAEIGETVTIYGVDFGFIQSEGETVTFAPGIEAEVLEWSDSYINVVAPDDAVDGDLFVTRVDQGTSYESNRMFFNVIEPGQEKQPPMITLLSPSRGPVGTVVTILGLNFGPMQLVGDRVSIGYQHLTIHSWQNDTIEAEIPQFAESGDIVVIHDGMASNARHFDVGNYLIDDPPVVTSVEPALGARGEIVQINGDNFGGYVPGSVAFLGAVPMGIISWVENQILAIVPEQGNDGDIRVYHHGALSNSVPFVVLPNAPNLYGLEQL